MSRIRVLLIDDDEDDQVLTRGVLDDIDPHAYELETVSTYDDGLAAIARGVHDVYLLDYRLGERDGLELLRTATSAGCTAPLILLTGLGDREIDSAAMRAGAADYLAKGQMTPELLERSIRHALERTRTLEALRESEERFRLLVDGVRGQALFMLGDDGQISSWNEGAERLTDYPATDVLGRDYAMLFSSGGGASGAQARRLLDAAQASGDSNEEVELVRRDGSCFWAEVAITALRRDAGELRGFATVVRDITERRRAEAERIELLHEQGARAEAEAAVRAREAFLSVAAHELKTPVANLRAYATFFLRAESVAPPLSTQRVHRGLAVIDRESAKLTRLVEQLLNLSQLDSGQLDLHVQWSDVAKLVREQARGAQVRTPRATIRVEGPDALMANVDPTRLGQIVANLLDNAAKHTPIDRMIDIRLDDATDVLRIAVRDYGPGIPIERRAGLFQRNPPAEVHNQTAGLGLGLYLTRRLVELHGGTVGVDFPPEGGACFWVQLPAGEPAHGQETVQLSAS